MFNSIVFVEERLKGMKKKLVAITKFIYFLGWFYILLGNSAEAYYIDPSAVTYIIQAVAAVFIALGALITVFRHRIVKFFKKEKKQGKKEIHVAQDLENTIEDK